MYCYLWQIQKNLKYYTSQKNSITWNKCKNEEKKIFKEDESIEILEILGLIKNI